MLKRKMEVNYRRANGRFQRCKYCARNKWTPVHAIGGQVLRHDWRCEIIGLQNSRRCGVRDDHVCDRHVPSRTGNGGVDD